MDTAHDTGSARCERLKAIALFLLDKLGVRGVQLEVILVSDETMRVLNRHYRGKDRTTNVLSIEYPGDEFLIGDCRLLGEVYLAPAYIARAADDLARLLIHGVLHLLGYSHETERDRIAMERREETLNAAVRRRFYAQPPRPTYDAQHRTRTRRRLAHD